MANEAVGMIETKGLVALVQATDAMLKAASVTFMGWNKVGSGLCSVYVCGDVGSVCRGRCGRDGKLRACSRRSAERARDCPAAQQSCQRIAPMNLSRLRVTRAARYARMFIAKVIGNVVSTQKIAKFRGAELLLIQPYISREGKPSGLRRFGCGCRQRGSRGGRVRDVHAGQFGPPHADHGKNAPVDAVIVGIVDSVEVEGAALEKP